MDVAADPHHGVRALLADKVLVKALTVSIGLHITILAIRFVDPELLRVRSTDPPLDIILVNAKSETRPGKPEALAQANLDGGGTTERGRRTSPLPNSFEMRDGDALQEARKSVQQLEEEQKRLLSALKDSLQLRPNPRKEAYLFLGNLRATLVPTIAVPVVLLGTFGVLGLFGFSNNMLTMFAMVLAIGLLVDDAIVVVENVEA